MRRGAELQPFSIEKVRNQLHRNSKLMDQLGRDRVVRLGAMSDIVQGAPSSIRNYRAIIEVLHEFGYYYMLVTKSAHSIDREFLELIRDTNGILGVTTAYYSDEAAAKLENIVATPPAQRRQLVEDALAMGINVVLRLNPMHPDFMMEHIRTLDWYASVGGTRVILEALRIIASWAFNMPEVDFSRYVTYKNGGCYNGYYTPHRDTQEWMFRTMIDVAKWAALQYSPMEGPYQDMTVTICGDMESNDKLAQRTSYDPADPDSILVTDCCQASDVWSLEVPPRTWEQSQE